MSESTIYNVVRRAALRAGIVGPMSPHKLRHGHATDGSTKGASLRLLQETLGHSDPSTTAIYAKVNPEESSGDFLEV